MPAKKARWISIIILILSFSKIQAQKCRLSSFLEPKDLKVDLSYPKVIKDKNLAKLIEEITISDISSRNPFVEFNILNHLTLTSAHTNRFVNSSTLKHLNRYGDILPFWDTMVRLDDKGLDQSNYINANFVKDPFKLEVPTTFIATQGPLKETCGHFWQLADKSNTNFIVAIIEKALLGEKCHEYWPVDKINKTCGYYDIEESGIVASDFLDLRKLTVKREAEKDEKIITHSHLHSWLDKTVLDKKYFKDYVKFLKFVYLHAQKNPGIPIIVHCSAGVGRTGTFIASYYLYELWASCKERGELFHFSVFGLVRYTREQRYLAVQTPEQYALLYEIVTHFE